MTATLQMQGDRSAERLRIGIFQRRLAEFRVPVFSRLAQEPGVALTVFVAEEPSNARQLPFDCHVLSSWSFSLGGSRFLLQRRFLKEAAQQDVVLLEGSMRFLTSAGVVLTRRVHGAAPVWWTSLYDPKFGGVAFPAGFKGWALDRLLKRVAGVVTYSESAAAVLRSRRPSLRSVAVAPNVLDTDLIAQAQAEWLDDPPRLARFARERGFLGRPIVLFVGRLVPAKRLDDLLLGFELLRSRRPDLDPLLVIVGDGPERRRLQRLARSLGISRDVRWFGEIREVGDVCPFFLRAKSFVLPGAGGLGLYQALAHGVPVVATHADGTERDLVLEGETGFLCAPGDVETLARRAEAILELAPEAWFALSTTCLKLAREEFHVRRMVRGLLQAAEHANAASLVRDTGAGPGWQAEPTAQGMVR